jgi:hypothetical protein
MEERRRFKYTQSLEDRLADEGSVYVSKPNCFLPDASGTGSEGSPTSRNRLARDRMASTSGT